MATIATPLEFVSAVADFHLPPKIDGYLQTLMDRNTEGALSPAEREELEALVELAKPSRCYAYRHCACSDGLCMSLSRAEIKQFVESCARQRCEYCRMHQSLQGASFHVEHIVPVSLGVRTLWITWPGLALAVISQSRIVSLLSIPRRVGKCACFIHALTAGKNIWRGRATCWWGWPPLDERLSRPLISITRAAVGFGKRKPCSGCFLLLDLVDTERAS
jgi:hypothetical protein